MTNDLEVLKEQKDILYLSSYQNPESFAIKNCIKCWKWKSQLSKCPQAMNLFCLF